jgi:hypothetical protein
VLDTHSSRTCAADTTSWPLTLTRTTESPQSSPNSPAPSEQHTGPLLTVSALLLMQQHQIMDPADVVEGTDQVLEDLGHTPTRYEDQITWRMPTSDEATKLELKPGTPVGRLVRTTFDQEDVPVEVYVVILPGDKHVLLTTWMPRDRRP